MDATSTGPQHLRRQWGETRVYNRTLSLENNNGKSGKQVHTDMSALR